MYAEDGSLLAEYGEGSAATSGSAQYLWLPTANGPMPIAAVVNGQTYAVHSDHLNTPRKLTQANGQAVWQWAYSAFGDEQPTTAAKRFTSEMTVPTTGATSTPDVTFNLRYPGQYFDKETNLHYNYFRTYAPGTGRYTQADPIGLDGGWSRFVYAESDPLSKMDWSGLKIELPNPTPNNKPPKGGKNMCVEQMPTYQTCHACCIRYNPLQGQACRESCSHRDPPYPDAPIITENPSGPSMCKVNIE